MAATEKRQISRYSKSDGQEPQAQRIGKIAASQGLMIPGSLLYLSQAGTFKAVDTSDGTDAISHVLNTEISTELAANAEIYVQAISADDVFAVYVENNGTDAAATQAIVGDQYGLTVSATAGEVGYVTLDTNNSNAVVEVVDVMGNVEPELFDLTSAPGVALVKFLNAPLQAAKA